MSYSRLDQIYRTESVTSPIVLESRRHERDKNGTVTLDAFGLDPAFDGARDLMGADLDIARKLAPLRQEMAGFGGSGLTNRGQ